jgi:F-type H+-transporting ATPase subunit delta
MKNTAVAKRYAEALYSVASERGQADAVEQDLKGILEVLNSHPELVNILEHPGISIDAKKKQVAELFQGRVSDLVLNFLNLLFDRRRQDAIAEMYKEYVELANAARGRIKAEVESAVPLSEEELNELKSKLGANGKQVDVATKVNPALIGGLKVRVGDRVFDYTVSGQLERFRQTLKY